MINLVVTTHIWKRPLVEDFSMQRYARLIDEFRDDPDMRLEVVIAGSEGDKSRSRVEKHGLFYVEVPNRPLSRKQSAPVRACHELGLYPDVVMIMGADDFASKRYMKAVAKMCIEREEIVGVLDAWIYGIKAKKLFYWPGYVRKARRGDIVGAGRCIPKKILERSGWYICPPTQPRDKGIDYASRLFFRSLGARQHGVRMETVGPLLVLKYSQTVSVSWQRILQLHEVTETSVEEKLNELDLGDVFEFLRSTGAAS